MRKDISDAIKADQEKYYTPDAEPVAEERPEPEAPSTFVDDLMAEITDWDAIDEEEAARFAAKDEAEPEEKAEDREPADEEDENEEEEAVEE